jgi:hypothetical protein
MTRQDEVAVALMPLARAYEAKASSVSATVAKLCQFPNRFDAPCAHCALKVREGAGVLWKEGDKYKTAHKEGECAIYL